MFDTTLDFILYPLGLLFTVMTIYNGYNGWDRKRLMRRDYAEKGEIVTRFMDMRGYTDHEKIFEYIDAVESCIVRNKNGEFVRFQYPKFAELMNDKPDFTKQARDWGTKIIRGQDIFKQEKQKQEND